MLVSGFLVRMSRFVESDDFTGSFHERVVQNKSLTQTRPIKRNRTAVSHKPASAMPPSVRAVPIDFSECQSIEDIRHPSTAAGSGLKMLALRGYGENKPPEKL